MYENVLVAAEEPGGLIGRESVSITVKGHEVNAIIDSISPYPADAGETVYFIGHGVDSCGHEIVAYAWRSDKDGVLSENISFSKTNLTMGSHNIYFKVKCATGVWSEEVAWSKNPLSINSSFSLRNGDVDPTSGSTGETYTFSVDYQDDDNNPPL